MANIKSAKKRARQAIKRRLHNKTLKSEVYTYVKRARTAIDAAIKNKNTKAEVEAAQTTVKQAMQTIDKMIPKGIFHKNKSARLKKRLNDALKELA